MTISKNKRILVVESEIGNTGSVSRAIKNLGYDPIVSKKKEDIFSSNYIILPGVGSFDQGIARLEKYDLKNNLIRAVNEKGIFLLGICLGMQMLATTGYENKETKGLDLIPGTIEKLEVNKSLRLPHIGWNQVNFNVSSKLITDIPNKKDFYFVHSYFFKSRFKKYEVGCTNYGMNFPSIINKDNIYGVQFHPEKSLKFGIKIIENFLKI